MNTTITAFYSDDCELSAVKPLVFAAQQRGIPFRTSRDVTEEAEIGLYLPHVSYKYAKHAAFSCVMLHDLAQGHDCWPDIWCRERWDYFDVGILPNDDWAERWRQAGGGPWTKPGKGVFVGGWPKSDAIFDDREKFERKAGILRGKLGLAHERSILYAPSWEYGSKQEDFITSLSGLPVNLLIKQAPWPETHPQWRIIREAAERHKGIAPNVHFIDPRVDIMQCLALADALVSDESSVIVESLVFAIPALWVSDWLIPDTAPPRPACFPLDFAFKTTRARLTSSVLEILKAKNAIRSLLEQQRDRFFPYRGKSSDRILDIILRRQAGAEVEGNLATEAEP